MVGAPADRFFVVRVDPSGSFGADGVGGTVGLSASADTAAAAGHHFDEVEGRLSLGVARFADLFQDLGDVPHLVGDGDADLLSGDVELGGFDAFHAAHGQELVDLSAIDVEPEVKTVLARLLDLDPARRYESADAVIDALAGAMGRSLAAETFQTRESRLRAAPLMGREAEVKRSLT